MNRTYRRSIVAALFVFIGIAAVITGNRVRLSGSGCAEITSFSVSRPALRPGETTTVRVELRHRGAGPLTYDWKAGAGTLNADSTDRVTWTAPEREGHYRIGVQVTTADGHKDCGSLGILVAKHPAAQLVMSADPMCGTEDTSHNSLASMTAE